MTKKPKPDPQPEPVRPEDRLVAALKNLLPQDNPVMVTAWISIVEYMDEHGNADLAAFCSHMPPWRLSGIFEAGHSMLVDEPEFDDYEE